MKDALLTNAQSIATEAEAFDFKAIANDFIGKFTSFMGDVKESFLESLKDIGAGTTGFAPSSSFQKRVAGADYIALREVEIYVPVGLRVSYLDYLDALQGGQLIADRLLEQTFEPACRYFALLCALPENLGSLSAQRHIGDIALWEKERNEVKKELSKCFVQNDNTQTRRFGDQFERLADWKESMNKLADLNDRAAKARPDQIIKKVNELSEIIDRLIIGIRNKPDVFKMNGITAKGLAELTMDLAQITEFYASHRYLLQTLNAALADTAKKMDNMKF